MGYITFEHVSKVYQMGDSQVLAANDVNFEIEKGDLCVILGPSGAGKTTVLNLLGGMDQATSGKIIVDGKDDHQPCTGQELTEYRRLDVGFVFQFYNLMPNLTALENVELARQVCPKALDPVQVLEQVGLGERMNNFPAQLSGGEQQRVSIARALCKNPAAAPVRRAHGRAGLQDRGAGAARCSSEHQPENTGATVVIITHNAADCAAGHAASST